MALSCLYNPTFIHTHHRILFVVWPGTRRPSRQPPRVTHSTLQCQWLRQNQPSPSATDGDDADVSREHVGTTRVVLFFYRSWGFF